jgi:hypothetical protein
VDQKPLDNVVMFSQVGASHAAGVVAVGEYPLDQLTTPPRQLLALWPLQPLPIPQ